MFTLYTTKLTNYLKYNKTFQLIMIDIVEFLKTKLDGYINESKVDEAGVEKDHYLLKRIDKGKKVIYRFQNGKEFATLFVEEKQLFATFSVPNEPDKAIVISDKKSPLEVVNEIKKYSKWAAASIRWALTQEHVLSKVDEAEAEGDGDGKIENETEFTQAATALLKKMHGDDFDQSQADEIIKDLIDRVNNNELDWIGAYSAITRG